MGVGGSGPPRGQRNQNALNYHLSGGRILGLKGLKALPETHTAPRICVRPPWLVGSSREGKAQSGDPAESPQGLASLGALSDAPLPHLSSRGRCATLDFPSVRRPVWRLNADR